MCSELAEGRATPVSESEGRDLLQRKRMLEIRRRRIVVGDSPSDESSGGHKGTRGSPLPREVFRHHFGVWEGLAAPGRRGTQNGACW